MANTTNGSRISPPCPISIQISNGKFDGELSSLRPPAINIVDFTPIKDDTNINLFSKSFFTNHKILIEVVEAISYTLQDPDRISYGSQGEDRHFFENGSFHPDRCSWDGNIKYEHVALRKSITGKTIEDYESDSFPISFQLQKILPDNTSDTADENSIGEGSFYNVFITVPSDSSTKGKKVASIETSFRTVCHDISRALNRLKIPDFHCSINGRTKKKFREVYLLKRRIKSGAFATVCLSLHRESKRRYATKCILRKGVNHAQDSAVYGEVSILSSIKHKYICPLQDFFFQDDCYFLVMEYETGGDLFDRIGSKTTYNEKDARDVCQQLLEAIAYLHSNNIAHCDLKPKNLLLVSKDNDSNVKLADFGFATHVFAPKSLTKQCGTPYFVAPEIIKHEAYDQSVDMWSVGVIIYCLLCGRLPFNGRKQIDLYKAILSCDYHFDAEWDGISDNAKCLIRNLLVIDPTQRFSVHDAMKSPWFSSDRCDMLRKNSLDETMPKLKVFNARLKLKSAILATTTMFKLMSMRRSSQGLLKDDDDDQVDVDYASDTDDSSST